MIKDGGIGEKSSVRGHLPRESYRKSEEALCSPDCGRLETLFRMSWRWLYLEKVLPKKLTYLLPVRQSAVKCEIVRFFK